MNELLKCGDMLDSLPFDVYAVDINTNELVFANKNFKNRRTFVKGEPCYQVINGRDSRCLFCKRDELIDEHGTPNGKTLTYEHFNEVDDGWYQVQEKAVIWDGGQVVKYVIAVDINELKSTQNRLAEAHAELAIKNKELELAHIQQAKQAQLGELLDLIAHQWKQPLSAVIILFDELKLLQNMGELDKESVMKIYSDGHKTIGAINKTLDEFRSFFSPSSTKVVFDTVAAIQNTIDLISKKLSYENITVELAGETQNAKAYGVASEFAQVVLALLTNGSEAIAAKRERDGKHKQDYNGLIKIGVSSDKDELNINFCDNGIGINEEFLQKIFKNRFTTKKNTGGSGVGLSMAKFIIEEKMEGKISASGSDMGACFEIKLPALD